MRVQQMRIIIHKGIGAVHGHYCNRLANKRIVVSFNDTAVAGDLGSGIEPMKNDVLPAQSITLFVLPAISTFDLQAIPNSPAGQLGLQLNGQAGQTYILQSSTNLIHWTPISTNQAASNSFEVFLPTTNAAQFYRAVWNTP